MRVFQFISSSRTRLGSATNVRLTQLFADVLRVFDELAITFFTPIILFPVMGIAVSFDVRQSALWAAKVVH